MLHLRTLSVAGALLAGGVASAPCVGAQTVPATPVAPTAPAPTASLDSVIDPGARPIPLAEAVRLAQRNAPADVQTQGARRTSRASVRSAFAAFIPTVNVSTGATRSFSQGTTRLGQNGEVLTVSQNPWAYNSGLNFGVDLFDGGRRLFDVGAARAGVQAAESNNLAQEFRTSLDVKQQYFAVLAAREAEGAARTQLAQAQQQLRASVTRVSAGAATKSDSLRSLIQVGNAQLALLTAQNNVRVADASLTRLVGATETVTAMPADSTTESFAIPLDTTDLFALAARGPAIEQARANLSAARANRRAARAPYLPTISVSYSRSGSGIDSRYGLGPDTYTCPTQANPAQQCPSYAYNGALRFGLSYPLFNQLAREEQVTRADVSEDVADATLRDTRLLAKQNIVQYLGQLRTAQERIAIQRVSVAAAEEDLRVQQQRYALGASTLLDVLTSQTTLDQARAALIQARFDYRTARAQIETVIGRELTQ